MKEPEMSVEEITPAYAAQVLATMNDTNFRKISRTYVDLLTTSIRKNNWDMNGEPIIFDTDGSLIDGQHRMAAVIQAKKSIRSVVIRGVAPSAAVTIDLGKRRGTSCHLTALGYASANQLACVAGIWMSYLDGERGKQLLYNRWGTKEIVQFIKKDGHAERILDILNQVQSAGKFSSISVLTGATVIAQEHYPPGKALEFANQVAKQDFPRGSPAALLVKRLVDEKSKTLEGRMQRWLQMVLMGRAIKAHCEGTTLAKLQAGKIGHAVFPSMGDEARAA